MSADLTPRTKVAKLEEALRAKEEEVNNLNTKLENYHDLDKNDSGVLYRKHDLTSVQYVVNDKGFSEQKRIGTRGSMQTANILSLLDCQDAGKTEGEIIADKFISMFRNPLAHAAYLESQEFATDLMSICDEVRGIFEEEKRCLYLQSPVYVFGDIHGNLEDLHFFCDNIWKLGMDLTAGNFLFLGDYVDRGLNCLECVAYLFSLKLLNPKKVFMLRGNHETRDVNSWVDHYKERSFLYQCQHRFGEEIGEVLWEECNQVFDRLPLACVIDHELFCIHGGLPRLAPGFENEIDCINSVPHVAGIMPPYRHETPISKQIAADCIWSDPASEHQEKIHEQMKVNPSYVDYSVANLDKDGFGQSPRGGGVVCFGNTAIHNFLVRNDLSYIIRAHEAHAHGVAISKAARVFTVFSTSKDHKQGGMAMAGCILVDVEKIQVINRSPIYANKYVHRATSIANMNLSKEEVQHRQSLGLIRNSIMDEDSMKRAAEAAAKLEAHEAEMAKQRELQIKKLKEEKERRDKERIGLQGPSTDGPVNITTLAANQKPNF